jgi:hypothetical protein
MNLESRPNGACVFAFAHVDRHDAVAIVRLNRASFRSNYFCGAMQECLVDFCRELPRFSSDETRRVSHVSVKDGRLYIYRVVV